MINYNITDPASAENLVRACRKFNEDIDVIYQRQVIDAKSILGVMSLIGHVVSLRILTDDEHVEHLFETEIYK